MYAQITFNRVPISFRFWSIIYFILKFRRKLLEVPSKNTIFIGFIFSENKLKRTIKGIILGIFVFKVLAQL